MVHSRLYENGILHSTCPARARSKLSVQEKGNVKKYIIAIKSGPNWGNSRQIAKMRDDFRKARRILGAHKYVKNIVAVNGCCYGKDNQPDKGDYLKLCGQAFWKLISGSDSLYTDIIEPLGHKAKEKNDLFMMAYAEIINRFTFEFGKEFCVKGRINWKKLVKFNSGK